MDIGMKFDSPILAISADELLNNSALGFEIYSNSVIELNRPGKQCKSDNDVRLEDCFQRFFAKRMGCIFPWDNNKLPELRGNFSSFGILIENKLKWSQGIKYVQSLLDLSREEGLILVMSKKCKFNDYKHIIHVSYRNSSVQP